MNTEAASNLDIMAARGGNGGTVTRYPLITVWSHNSPARMIFCIDSYIIVVEKSDRILISQFSVMNMARYAQPLRLYSCPSMDII